MGIRRRLAVAGTILLLNTTCHAFVIDGGAVSVRSARVWSAEDGDTDRLSEREAILRETLRQRPVAKRRRAVRRRPRYYWSSLENIRQELRDFWQAAGVRPSSPLTIPNEVLLYYYERHDLRGAIAGFGGREILAEELGGAAIMPGRWTTAVAESPELQQLLAQDARLQADRPPNEGESQRWRHQSTRKPKGYWSLKVVIQELYEYTNDCRQCYNRPSVWMPRPSELSNQGRDDLKQALNRFGGTQRIARLAGMIEYREWSYFEGQLELLLELKRYCDEYCASNYREFPSVTEIRNKGFRRLHSLILYYGGRKFLALRLGMAANGIPDSDPSTLGMNWGAFDLFFAVRLLMFVRDDQLKKNPPLQSPMIGMPSRNKLLNKAEDGDWLDEKIVEFGGYENVARRLGLALG